MNYSESPEVAAPTPYDLRVYNVVFVQAKVLGISTDDLLEFIGSIATSMMAHTPNYKSNIGGRVWVFRGFYPKTTLFLKISVMDAVKTGDNSSRRFIKVRPLDSTEGSAGHKWDKIIKIDSNALETYLTDTMENHLLGAKHKIEPIMAEKIKMPKCMSPKGMPLFKYKKPKRKKGED